MRRLALIATLLVGAVAWIAATAGAGDTHTYTVEVYNAFGIVPGSDVRVAGVNAGSVTSLDINSKKRAVLTVELSGPVSELGTETKCSSEPQSLIAEYFLDCEPKGPPITDPGDAEHPAIPASQVQTTVQSDLVQNTLREPFKQRLQLLLNEFGTALAGNPHELNQAIRLGAPALGDLKRALDILASQNATIRDLNANSDRIIGQLAARKADVIRFIQEARDTAATSAERRADLSRNFDLLDNFLHQLRPTLVQLGNTAQQQTPLLNNLRAAAPGLNTLAVDLPAFNRATDRSLTTLGEAAQPGTAAFKHGLDEIQALKASGKHAFSAADALDKFLLDIDNPSRRVETDARAADTCSPGTQHPKTKPCYSTGRSAPTGYTGMEGLLNYVYYQTGALNQFDAFGHLLHFSLFDVGASPCGSYNAGDNPSDNEPPPGAHDIGVPKAGGGTTTSASEADPCVSWLGANQPGLNQEPGVNDISPYDPSVCPDGSTDLQLCDPNGPKRKQGAGGSASGRKGGAQGGGQAPTSPTAPGPTGGGPGGGLPGVPGLPGLPDLPGGGGGLPGLDDLLGLGHHGGGGGLLGHHHHGGGLLGGGGGGGGLLDGGGGGLGGGVLKSTSSGDSGQAAQDLLNFLYAN
jgi:ABC-type transporter Mla subunit MlaD